MRSIVSYTKYGMSKKTTSMSVQAAKEAFGGFTIKRQWTTARPPPVTRAYADIFEAAAAGDVAALKRFVETEKVDVNSTLPGSQETPLFKCVQEGHLNAVKYLIGKGANVNAVDKYGYNSLLWALDTATPNLDVIKYLIDKGADFNVRDRKGYAPVHWAATNGKLDILKYLVDKGADYQLNVNSGETPLHWAAIKGHLDVVAYLLDDKGVKYNGDIFSAASSGYIGLIKYYIDRKKISVDYADSEGATALHKAVGRGQLDVVKYLIEEKRASINVKDHQGDTPLSEAAASGRLAVVKYLTEKGATVAEDHDSGNTPMNRAAVGGYADIVEYLLDGRAGAPPTKPASLLRPLKDAIKAGKLDVVRYLMAVKSVGLESVDVDGDTRRKKVSADINICNLFSDVHRVDYVNVLRYLLQRGADIDTKCASQDTYCQDLWSCAAYYGHLNTIRYLVENKIVDIDRGNSGGRTALHCAGVYGHLNVIRYLVEHGANITARALNDHLPLWESVIEEHDDVSRYLIGKHQAAGTLNLCLEDILYTGYMDTIKYIVQRGADVNKRSSAGLTPVMIAAKFDQLAAVKFLVSDKRADFNVLNNDGETALHLAVRSNSLDVAKYLLEQGANVDEQSNDGWTPLHVAASGGSLEMAKHLVEVGRADLNALDYELHAPLHRAAENGKLNVVRYLVEKGAEHLEKVVKYSNKDYFASLFVAAQRGHVDVVRYLYEQKHPDLNALGKSDASNRREEGTLLHEAIANGHLEVVKYLVEAGADLSKEDRYNDTPLALAIKKGQTMIAKYLETASSQRAKVRRSADTVQVADAARNVGVRPTSMIDGVIQWTGKLVTRALPAIGVGGVDKLDIWVPADGTLVLLDVGVRWLLGSSYQQPKHDALLTPAEIVERKVDPVALNVISTRSSGDIDEDVLW